MTIDIEEQYDKIYRYCYMKLQKQQQAEDVTQETFLRFLENHSYRERGKEMAYLYTIARNLCVDYYRKKVEMPLEDEITGENGEDVRIENIMLRDAVLQLEREEQELIFLRYVNELTIYEICKVLEMSRFQIYRKIKTCLYKLKQAIGEEELH
ncbi:MAG: sigma-70 family RNA polymerase sigma factor [Lachnospiraceae bacterium]